MEATLDTSIVELTSKGVGWSKVANDGGIGGGRGREAVGGLAEGMGAMEV